MERGIKNADNATKKKKLGREHQSNIPHQHLLLHPHQNC
jgi:hypothetical protein